VKIPSQVVGNAGSYYICYELSRRGWNVLPTSRKLLRIPEVTRHLNDTRARGQSPSSFE